MKYDWSIFYPVKDDLKQNFVYTSCKENNDSVYARGLLKVQSLKIFKNELEKHLNGKKITRVKKPRRIIKRFYPGFMDMMKNYWNLSHIPLPPKSATATTPNLSKKQANLLQDLIKKNELLIKNIEKTKT